MKVTRRDKAGFATLDVEKMSNRLNLPLKGQAKEIYKRKDTKTFNKEKAKSLIISGLMACVILLLIFIIYKTSIYIDTLPQIIGVSALVITLVVFVLNANLEDFKRLVKWLEIKISPKTLKKCTKEFTVIEAHISDINSNSFVAIVYKGEKIYIHKNKFISPIIEGEKYIAIGRKENYVVKSVYPLDEPKIAESYNDLTEKDISRLKQKKSYVNNKLSKRKKQVILRNALKVIYTILALTILINANLMDNITFHLPQVVVNTNAIFLLLVIICTPIIALLCTKEQREKELREEKKIITMLLNKPSIGSYIKGEIIAVTTIKENKENTLITILNKKTKQTYEISTEDIFDKGLTFGQKVCLYHIRGNNKYIITK